MKLTTLVLLPTLTLLLNQGTTTANDRCYSLSTGQYYDCYTVSAGPQPRPLPTINPTPRPQPQPTLPPIGPPPIPGRPINWDHHRCEEGKRLTSISTRHGVNYQSSLLRYCNHGTH